MDFRAKFFAETAPQPALVFSLSRAVYQSSMDRGSFEAATDDSGEPSPSFQLDKDKTT